MARHNGPNERIKREYFTYLEQAKRQSVTTVDAVAKALASFEADTNCRDFKAFHCQQAVAFKKHLAEREGRVGGQKLSKATQYATLAHLKRFFEWLAMQPRYKSRIKYTDAEYFNLTDKDTRVATARRQKRFPTIEQVKHVISRMPYGTDIERRNRALIAFVLLTGARDGAIASVKLRHIDLVAGSVYQDAREVKTKFSKTFTTFFFPVGDDVRRIVEDWVMFLREVKLWGYDAPLFPATKVVNGATREFEVVGLKPEHWSTAAPIRTIFREAFVAAGLPYFKPHSLRDTLTQLGERLCQTPEEFKAWSQNVGHEKVLTTFSSYGQVAYERQGEIIQALGMPQPMERPDADAIADAVVRKLAGAGLSA